MTARLRPLSWWDDLFAGEFLFEIAIALISIAIGTVQGTKYLSEQPPKTELGWSLIVFAFLMGAVIVVRAVARRRKAMRSGDPNSLDAVLYTLHSVLLLLSKEDGDIGLRLCVFVPGSKANQIHQISNYVGVDPPYGCRRDMPDSCGVVGLAFRSGAAQYDSLPPGTHVIDYLVDSYGFDRKEASSMQQDRQSWAAVPVGGPGEVVAAIFLDCKAPGFFGTNKNHQKRKLLEAATVGVAKFLAAQ